MPLLSLHLQRGPFLCLSPHLLSHPLGLRLGFPLMIREHLWFLHPRSLLTCHRRTLVGPNSTLPARSIQVWLACLRLIPRKTQTCFLLLLHVFVPFTSVVCSYPFATVIACIANVAMDRSYPRFFRFVAILSTPWDHRSCIMQASCVRGLWACAVDPGTDRRSVLGVTGPRIAIPLVWTLREGARIRQPRSVQPSTRSSH